MSGGPSDIANAISVPMVEMGFSGLLGYNLSYHYMRMTPGNGGVFMAVAALAARICNYALRKIPGFYETFHGPRANAATQFAGNVLSAAAGVALIAGVAAAVGNPISPTVAFVSGGTILLAMFVQQIVLGVIFGGLRYFNLN